MTSIRDVAAEAGVAISTVSKVLNHYPNVSDETKKRVEDAVTKLHFVPNAVAAALSSKHAARVALIINPGDESGIMNEINMQYLTGGLQSARTLGLDVVTLFSTMTDHQPLEEAISYLRTQSISGLVIFNLNRNQPTLQSLAEHGDFKTVVVDAPFINESTSSISIDNKAAQKDVAEHVITGIKAKTILYITGSEDGYVTSERLEGIKEFAEEKKIKLIIKDGQFSQKTARQITEEYAEKSDAIVCASDMMAIGSMRKLMEMDIFRPVCGFDGISLMGYAGKQMFTVRQDFYHIAFKAVSEVSRLMNGGTGIKISMPYEIVRMTYEDVIR